MHTGQAIVISACRALGLPGPVPAIAAALCAPATWMRHPPASLHLLYHG